MYLNVCNTRFAIFVFTVTIALVTSQEFIYADTNFVTSQEDAPVEFIYADINFDIIRKSSI